VFDGSNRGFGAWLTPYKTRTDVTYYLNQNWRIINHAFSKSVGSTTEYHCTVNSFNDCTFVRQAQASDGRISTQATYMGNNHDTFISHEVVIPIRSHGYGWGLVDPPGISYAVHYTYGPGGFRLSGSHDGAPNHEIWGGYIPGEYVPFMLHSRRCEFGAALVGVCTVGFNIKV
jgi:hypothetical protein